MPPVIPNSESKRNISSGTAICISPKQAETERERIGVNPGRGARGFSLVEVVLALGLCAFTLVSLVSLMPVSLDSARQALEISRVAKAFQTVGTELTQSTFSSVEAMTSGTNTWYFDYDGNVTDKVSNRYYTVTATINASPIQNQASTNLLRVRLESRTPSQTSIGSTTITICDMGY